ncbi:MAG: phosphatase PAP2 family protein [Emcibacter sp.]|nr:phosphatase PAP2 family protein [Emcibacter sp.]
MSRNNENIPVMDRQFFQGNSLIFGAFLAYTACAMIFFLYNGLYEYVNFKIYKASYFVIFAVLLVFRFACYVLANRVRRGYYLDWKNIVPDLRENWLNLNVLFTVFMPLLGISFMMSIFGSVKTLFPMVNPFYLDVPLMELDRALHFGSHPWELTHALFGSSMATEVLDFMYQLWFVLLMGFSVWMVSNHKMGHLRTKFLLCYILTWSILGTFLAVLLPAAGPCYYANFVDGFNVYAPLMDRIHEISDAIKGVDGETGLYTVRNQELLWSFYTDDYIGLGSGITAMPSMHVSFATLFYLTIREMNAKLGYLALLYLVIIQVTSVHLGWHYAVDGYVSIILTYGLWKCSGWLVARVCGAEQVVNPDNQDQYQPQAQIG